MTTAGLGEFLPASDVIGGPAKGLRGGAECGEDVCAISSGLKLDRTRIGGFTGGPPRSMALAVAGRTGGVGPEDITVDLLGDAV